MKTRSPAVAEGPLEHESEPHQTWRGNKGPRARTCTSQMFCNRIIGCIVLLLGVTEYLGEPGPRHIYKPVTPEPLERVAPNFNMLPTVKLSTSPDDFIKIMQMMRVCGAFKSQNFVKSYINFDFGGPHPTTVPLAKFPPLHRCCAPLWAKTSKLFPPLLLNDLNTNVLYSYSCNNISPLCWH